MGCADALPNASPADVHSMVTNWSGGEVARVGPVIRQTALTALPEAKLYALLLQLRPTTGTAALARRALFRMIYKSVTAVLQIFAL